MAVEQQNKVKFCFITELQRQSASQQHSSC